MCIKAIHQTPKWENFHPFYHQKGGSNWKSLLEKVVIKEVNHQCWKIYMKKLFKTFAAQQFLRNKQFLFINILFVSSFLMEPLGQLQRQELDFT
jgi:hypothetical protein